MISSVGTVDTIGTFGSCDMAERLRMADIVKATGLSKTTIIRYEETGKIPTAKRDGRGWRYYTGKDRDRIVEKLKTLDLI